MRNFRLYNTLFGWLSFIIAAIVYLLTLEPTTSLWDCGEFIASAYKFEVGHPPGAPLFMILARFFSLFASDRENVAKMINSLSALASAGTIMFLFWTITHLAKKVIAKDNFINTSKLIAILGSGLVGALAYTFSDTFWFSAVEGEVYATSSFFTAVVFWAILKWENIAHEKYANRWLVFIAYLMGLSIGIHLLNLLAIPAIVLVYYFKKYKPTAGGVLLAMIISMGILVFIQYGIIQRILQLASNHELLFVNKYHLPFNSGVFYFFALLLIYLIIGIIATQTNRQHSNAFYLISFIALNFALFTVKVGLIVNSILIIGYFLNKKNLLKTLFIIYLGILPGYILWHFFFSEGDKAKEKERRMNFNRAYNLFLSCITVILIGYSSFTIIVIRSLADPPMDENNPETVFSLMSYLNREQYGDRPLFKGQYYNSPMLKYKEGKPIWTKKGDAYIISDHKTEIEFDKRFITLFPRMFSNNKQHVSVYKEWGKIKGTPITIKNQKGEQVTVKKPTFGENLRFFFTYQVGFMYIRYFMWNFAGRQNDIQGYGGILKGNWITGISFIDNARLGPQDKLPEKYRTLKSKNKYYLLPLLLGLIGLVYHYKNHKKDFLVVLLLFILTGFAVVVYLNQNPIQPRERDYAYAGSFYAFAIWIGLGVLGLLSLLKDKLKSAVPPFIITLLCLIIVPGIMAKENWDDHDRSGRYTARDFAYNYLSTCAPNAILFTNGDNDTFPLWYLQEVEEVRTDVRVVNLMLLNTDWYIDQMIRKAYESDLLPFSLTKDKYIQGTRDVVYLIERTKDYIDLKQAVEFVASDNPKTKRLHHYSDKIDYFPSKSFSLLVDTAKVLDNGAVPLELADEIVPRINFRLNRSHVVKGELMVMDLLAHNNWERPVYFVAGGNNGALNLEEYFQLDGLAYRLIPIRTKNKRFPDFGRINTDLLYDNLMNKFSWGRMNEPDVYLDHFNVRTISVTLLRNRFKRLAEALIEEAKMDSAIAVLDRCMELMPNEKVPYDHHMPFIIYSYIRAGAIDKAQKIAQKFGALLDEELNYYFSLKPKLIATVDFDMKIALQNYQQLVILLKENLDNELSKELEMKFYNYYDMYKKIKTPQTEYQIPAE